MSAHISKQFDIELNEIRSEMFKMAALVEEQVRNAVDAFILGNVDAMAQVLQKERQVNELHIRLDNRCLQMIARRQPAASDLRTVLAVIKSVQDLERIGDKAARICKRGQKRDPEQPSNAPCLVELQDLTQYALGMLSKALNAFTRLDINTAAHVRASDETLDAHYRILHRQLIALMMQDPNAISINMEVLWIAKAIERVGDLAVNIAEQVVFLVNGQDIRHKTQEEIEHMLGTF